MKLDWQHVVIGAVVIGCATACIVLNKGDVLLRVIPAIGALSGVAALFKGSPIQPSIAPTTVFPDEGPTKKEGRSLPPGSP